MRKKPFFNSNVSSRKIASFFVLCVITLVVASFAIKGIVLVSKSRFDGEHRFTIAIEKAYKKPNKEITIISLEPLSRSVSFVVFPDGARTPVGRYLEIPIDGKLRIPEGFDSNLAKLIATEADISGKDIAGFLFPLLLSYKDVQTDLTVMDIFRVAWYAKSITKNNVNLAVLGPTLSENSIDKISSVLFADREIVQENISIQVVNATDVSGLGNRLARFITNMGGTVVSVTSGSVPEEKSMILIRGKRSYTLERLSTVFGFPIESFVSVSPTPTPPSLLEEDGKEQASNTESFVSDVIVVVGSQSLKQLVF